MTINLVLVTAHAKMVAVNHHARQGPKVVLKMYLWVDGRGRAMREGGECGRRCRNATIDLREEIQFAGAGDGLRAAGNLQFSKDVVEVFFHSADCQEEFIGNFLIGAAVGY